AGARIAVDAEALTHHAFAFLQRLPHQRPLAALAVEHAFGLRHDDLRPLLGRRHRLAQHADHSLEVIGAGDGLDSSGTDAPHGRLAGVARLAHFVVRAGLETVLSAGRGRIAVVDDHRDGVVLVEDGIADAGGEAVVPETAVAHHRDGTLALRLECRRAR